MWRAYSDALSLHRFNTRSRMAYTVYLVPSRAFWFPLRTDGLPHVVFLELLLLLAGASVFEGEFRDSGLVQLAFAECNQLQILIIGCLS